MESCQPTRRLKDKKKMLKVNYKLMPSFLIHFYKSWLIFIIKQQKGMASDSSFIQIMVIPSEMTPL
jgi:hypothetical protein